ncbi:bile acid:sodium symporter family protein [Nocardioides sp. NPDC087217]|uniref:bile acid:sodium symporter family protein n=1 Tax=Nocardioides sp. NPDC087217 TaxID=3364335 RepID=UPI00380253AB
MTSVTVRLALPLISVAGITGVVLAVVAGLALGYAVGRVCGMPISSRRAISIEVGMQNSGLAAALATVHFSPAAALPAAIFSVWHNVSGSILASYWSRRPIEAAEATGDGVVDLADEHFDGTRPKGF